VIWLGQTIKVIAGHVEVIMKRKNFKLGFRNASAAKQLEICDTHLARFAQLPTATQSDMDLAGVQAVVATAHASRQRIQQLRVQLKHEITGHRTHLRAAREAVSYACLHLLVQTNAEPLAMTAAGLTVRKDWQKVGLPAAPQNLTARATKYSGEIRLDWKRSVRRCLFHVQFNTNPLNEKGWRIAGGTRAQSYTVPDLVPGKLYYFRICAENIAGKSPWSNVTSARAV
jgi:hypothetical protein